MIRQPFYIFSGIILSVLTFYFYKHDFNLWVVGISGFIALAQFPAIFDEKKKKSKVSAKQNLVLDKNIPKTIERSITRLLNTSTSSDDSSHKQTEGTHENKIKTKNGI